MAKKFPSEEQDRFIVRFPDGMRAEIARLAKIAGRTMNAEIVHRLRQSIAAGLGSSVSGDPVHVTMYLMASNACDALERLVAALEREAQIKSQKDPRAVRELQQERLRLESMQRALVGMRQRALATGWLSERTETEFVANPPADY
jgi:Arc-like DNA binding domain